MATDLSTSLIVLVCALAVCNAIAPANHRFARITTTRLARLEQADESSPYPAAGFRPDREFILPSAQQLQRLRQQQQQERQQVLTPQKPTLKYGAPLKQQPQQQQQPQQPNLVYGAPLQEELEQLQQQQQDQRQQLLKQQLQQRQQLLKQQQQHHQQQPNLRYVSTSQRQRISQQQQQLQPQQPGLQYGAPVLTYRVPAIGSLPSAPLDQAGSTESLEETKDIEFFANSQRSSRLTDSRAETVEEDDDEESEESVTAEIDAKANSDKKAKSPQALTPAGVTTFFPYSAAGFVQPLAIVQPTAAGELYAKLQLQQTVFGFKNQQPLLAQPLIQPVAQPLVYGSVAAQYQSW